MVKFIVTFNTTSKQHEWKEVEAKHNDDLNPYIWEIITPNKGSLTIRNFPTSANRNRRHEDKCDIMTLKNMMTDDLNDGSTPKSRRITQQAANKYNDLVKKWPHFAYLLCWTDTVSMYPLSGEVYEKVGVYENERAAHVHKHGGANFYNPVEKQWVWYGSEMGMHHFDMYFPLLQVDIMNFILDWDRQTRTLVFLEHFVMREPVEVFFDKVKSECESVSAQK